MQEALSLLTLMGVAVTVTTGHQTEEGTGESVEAAVGAGEAGGREGADGSPPAEGGAGVRGASFSLGIPEAGRMHPVASTV